MWNRAIIILALAIISGVIAQIVLKKGSLGLPDFSLQNFWPITKEILRNKYLISWVFLGGVSAFLWMLAISKLELSFAFPAAQALSIILIVLLSYFFFAEVISLWRWIGIIFVIIGIFLMTK